MARIDARSVVADARPIIHLDELDCISLLDDLAPVWVPRAVSSEVARHRPALNLAQISCLHVSESPKQLRPELRALAQSMVLDAGELAALALMQEHGARLLLCDDSAARLAAESLGFTVHGTIGILVRAIRRRQRSRERILAILRSLPHRSTLHIAERLLETVITTVERG